MPSAAKYATGKYAWGVCDICGVSYELAELKGTTVRGQPTGLLSCPICWDPDHPQNFLPEAVTVDPEALRVARPEDYTQSRRMPCVFLVDAAVAQFFAGKVEVTTT